MRILYIHQFFATRESSLGLIRSYEFSRRMVEEGHEVWMITSASRLPEAYSKRVFASGTIDGIHVRSMRVAYSNSMSYARRIWSFSCFMVGASWLALTAPRPDVVLATSTPLTIGIPGWIVARLRRVPFVFEVRDLWPEAAIQMGAIRRESALGRLSKWLERFLYRKAAHVIALSPGMAEGVIAEGIESARVHMVPNSSDLDLFDPNAPKDAEFVERFGLAGKFIVAYTGAIGPSNAVEKSVPQAARLLLERGRTDIIFLLVGAGKCLPDIEQMKAEWGLSNLVLAQPMPKADIPRVTATADLMLALFDDKPILATNSPNKFFDAIASGRPVLVNQPGWTRELVEDNACGIYVPVNDPVAMADAIERLASEPELVSKLAANARPLAEREFARDDMAHKVIEVLQDAVGERSRG